MEKKYLRTIYIFLIFVISLFILDIIVYAIDYYAIQSPDYTQAQYDAFSDFYYVMSVVWPLIVIICFILWIQAFGIKSYPGKVALLLFLGLIVWFGAELFYPILWFFYDTETAPTWGSDFDTDYIRRILFIIGYFIMVAGLLLQLKFAQAKTNIKERGIIILFALIISILIIMVVIIPLLQYPVDEVLTTEVKFSLIFYSITDLIIMILVLILVFRYRGGEFSKAWLIISMGYLTTAIYDLLNVYFGWLASSEIMAVAYYFTDQVYYLQYALLALGALYFHQLLKSA